MKKITLVLVAIMLVFGMTQCKKEQPVNNNTDEGEKVYISMKVADDGGKHIVYPGTGAVVYNDGDVIYVGNNGHYVGTLTYANGTFNGTITSPSTSDYLHFYFVGGCTPSVTPNTSTTSFTVNIANQSTKLPVLSYGRSNIKYVDGTTAYTCMLENKCGLVKFVPSMETTKPITISGMKTTATINFATSEPGITPANTTGTMTLYSVSGSEKWAILLPQNEVVNPVVHNTDLVYPIVESVPAIINNMYYNTGVSINKGTPTGAISGLFTINANGDKVFFSKGNLQFHCKDRIWRFAENQYDRIFENNMWVSEFYNGWIDQFGWGTSGYNHGAISYQPWSVDTQYADRSKYYAYGISNSDLNSGDGTADWGYNRISNGGNAEDQWRTLTWGEWNYVLNTRSTSSDIRYVFATVDPGVDIKVRGLILLPDDWNTSTYPLENPGDYTTNIITTSDWPTLESAGAVFLPFGGYWDPSQGPESGWYNWQGCGGHYWTATAAFKMMRFRNLEVTTGSQNPIIHLNVRLVWKANY